MRFLEMFEPIQKGNFGLTDEAIYKSIQYDVGFVPVWGGEQEHVTETRWVSEKGRTRYNEPVMIFEGNGIIISLDGSAGRMTFVGSKRFALNHHAGFFKVRESANNVVDLEFFSIFYEKELEEASISEGSKTLSLKKIYSMDFGLPAHAVQRTIMERLRPLLERRDENHSILERINSLKSRTLSNNYSVYQAKDVPIREVLDYMSGNSGLTEEYLYSRIQDSSERKYRFLTGSTDYESSQYVHKCKHPKDSSKFISVIEDKDVIHVVRKGKAGSSAYFERGNYTINDDAYLLFLKDVQQKSLSNPQGGAWQVHLKWLMYALKPRFLEYSSSSDNGTWNMTGFFRDVTIDIPSYPEQVTIANVYDKLENFEKRVRKIDSKIEELLAKQITQD